MLGCKRFGYLTCNCRNKKEEKKNRLIFQNKFKVITSRVMQCGVREEVKVRRQEIMEKVKCFRCWKINYLKYITNFIQTIIPEILD